MHSLDMLITVIIYEHEVGDTCLIQKYNLWR